MSSRSFAAARHLIPAPLRVGRSYDGAINVASSATAFIGGREYAGGWYVDEPVTIDQLGILVTTLTAGATGRLLVRASDPDTDLPTTKLFESGDVSIAATGYVTAAISGGLALGVGRVYLCATFSAAPAGLRSRTTASGHNLGFVSAASDVDPSADMFYTTGLTYPTTPSSYGTPAVYGTTVPSVRARISSKP
jgi:hypothetical protein